VQPWRCREEDEKAQRPNDRWSTDLMYLQIGGRTYYFASIVDEYSPVHRAARTAADDGGIRREPVGAGGDRHAREGPGWQAGVASGDSHGQWQRLYLCGVSNAATD